MNLQNNDMQVMIAESFRAMLSDLSTGAAVRSAERSREMDKELWQTFVDNGFDLALVPESLGGSGLSLGEVASIPRACGYFAAPAPLAESMVARGIAGAAGQLLPQGAISLALGVNQDKQVAAHGVAWGSSSDLVLVLVHDEGAPRAILFRSSDATSSIHAGYTPAGETDMLWQRSDALTSWELPPDAQPVWLVAAMVCIQTTGAMERVLETSIRYVQERSQFGRPISGFQAIQHQLSVLTEDVFAARMASAWLTDSTTIWPRMEAIPAAKVVCSEAAARVSSIAHAVHGAMGITQEYELQLYTKRLHGWRITAGSESYWADIVGRQMLSGSAKAWETICSQHGTVGTPPVSSSRQNSLSRWTDGQHRCKAEAEKS